MPLVYAELRRLASACLSNERAEHTLQPTALVHETYLRLAGLKKADIVNRAHFLGTAAAVMRRVLVDHARRKRADKRGGGEVAIPLDELVAQPIATHSDVVALDDVLTKLETAAPVPARVVELRYFGGLTVEETAEYLAISPATVKRHWVYARLWLARALSPTPPHTASRRAIP
jgi:RNA polymerase sigma factor (TIGR02999 family)